MTARRSVPLPACAGFDRRRHSGPAAVGAGDGEARPISTSPSLYLNRELSWLEFNARVLAEAENEAVPLLERLKFHAIVASNLDEFFMVRVAGLKQQLTGEVGEIPPDGMTVGRAARGDLGARARARRRSRSTSLDAQLLPRLAEHGIVIVKPEQLPAEALAALDERFHNEIFPILTPIAIDPGHPFPHVRNKSLNLGVMFTREGDARAGFGVVQVPMMLPRLIEVSGVKSPDGPPAKHAFVLLEDLIARHVGTIFPGVRLQGRLHRSASRATSTSRSTKKRPKTPADDPARAAAARARQRGAPRGRRRADAGVARQAGQGAQARSRSRRVPDAAGCSTSRDLMQHRRARRAARSARRAVHAAARAAAARRRRHLRRHARAGRAPPSPVRVVRQRRRSHHARGRRSRRARDQADALSRRRRLADREGARARGRERASR